MSNAKVMPKKIECILLHVCCKLSSGEPPEIAQHACIVVLIGRSSLRWLTIESLSIAWFWEYNVVGACDDEKLNDLLYWYIYPILRHVDPMDSVHWGRICVMVLSARGPFYTHELTISPTWISRYINKKLLHKISYLFRNFNSATMEILKWMHFPVP